MIVEQFAGPGGWDTGASLLGVRFAHGYEYDRAACDTARVAGFHRRQIDVSAVTDTELRKLAADGVEGLVTSPPCPAWSIAGAGGARIDVDRIMAHLQAIRDAGEWLDYRDRDDQVVDLWEVPAIDHSKWADPTSALVLEAVRWALMLQPTWIAAEQVPGVLPFWQAWAELLRDHGYSVWTGVLSAEQYGVPQTRRRAFLVASREREVHEPAPTHRRYHPKTGNVAGDEHLPQWVSMGQALGWPEGRVGFPRKADEGRPATEDGYRDRDFRGTDEPSFVLTEKTRSWSRWAYRNGNQENSAVRPADAPAPTVHFGHALNEVRWVLRASFGEAGTAKPRPRSTDQPAATIVAKAGNYDWVPEALYPNGTAGERTGRPTDAPSPTIVGSGRGGAYWADARPATTIAGDSRVWPPGHKVNQADRDRLGAEEADERYGDRAGTDAVKVTVPEAACLQSFPVGYPWQGSDTARYRQVGDAVPPLLAAAVLAVALGREADAAEVCRTAYVPTA